MNTTTKVVLALAFSVAQTAAAAANCTLEELTDTAADGPLCLFYTGTAAYREKDFGEAAKNWKALIALKSVPAELAYLKLDAYNNLGFLYFSGMGVATNKAAAVDYWKYAYKAGHEEAAYHLCHARADADEAAYSRRAARGYCKEALRRYDRLKERGGSHDAIVGQLNKYLRAVAR